jgi:hypothetical protein
MQRPRLREFVILAQVRPTIEVIEGIHADLVVVDG